MSRYLVAYASTLVALVVGDLGWLGIMGKVLYRPTLGDIMLPSFRLAPAVAFYLLYAGGVVFFAVAPALSDSSWTKALLYGGLLGLIAYGTYDLTNMASLRNWTLLLTALDMVWGAVLTAVAATIALLVTRSVLR